MKDKFIQPAKPLAMEIVFFYACPHCQHEMPLVAPLQPSMITCEVCHMRYPIVPIDEASVQFVKVMLANGCAAVDADYL